MSRRETEDPPIRPLLARVEGLRLWLLLLAGITLPFFAFPPFRIGGRPVDAASVFGALFVAASLPALSALDRKTLLFLAAAIFLPLFRLIPPWDPRFRIEAFAASYAHWIFLAAFFAAAAAWAVRRRDAERLLGGQAAAGIVVALFGLYQLAGVPRGWPGTGAMIAPFQRAPFRLSNMLEMVAAGTSYVRPTSFFLEPAWMGGYLAWTGGVALSLAAGAAERRWRRLGLVAAPLCFAVAASSVSWGAYADAAAVLVGFFILLFLRRRKIARPPSRFLAAAVVGSLLVAVLALAATGGAGALRHAVEVRWTGLASTPFRTERMTSDVADSSWVRYRNFIHTLDLWRSKPLRGVGLGQYAFYADANPLPQLRFTDAWCGWAAAGAEMGEAGPPLLVLAIVLVGLLYRRHAAEGAAALAVAPLVAFAVLSQVHTGSYLDLWFWYPLSLAAVCARSLPLPLPVPGAGAREG